MDKDRCVYKECMDCINDSANNYIFKIGEMDPKKCKISMEDEGSCKQRKEYEREEAKRTIKERERREKHMKTQTLEDNFVFIMVILGSLIIVGLVIFCCILGSKSTLRYRNSGRRESGPLSPPSPSAYQQDSYPFQPSPSAPQEREAISNTQFTQILIDSNKLKESDAPPTYDEAITMNNESEIRNYQR